MNPSNVDDPREDRGTRRANPIDAHVGNRVRLRRMLLGISQERLGEQLGLTFQQVQKYEKGVNRIGASRLWDLANVLEVPIEYFYQEAPGSSAGSALPVGFREPAAQPFRWDVSPTRDSVELNNAFARISDAKTRRAILDLVRSLAPE
jgi:transcriptional regulator with XRE-family HTH domain